MTSIRPRLTSWLFVVFFAIQITSPAAGQVATGPPVLAPIANMTMGAASTADQGISATDPDADAIAFTSSGPTFMTLTSNPQVGSTRTGNIHLAPSFGTNGTFSGAVTATANAESSTRNFTINVMGPNNPPTLFQPANMTVDEGAMANQTLVATDPDGNPLSFSKVSGPTYVTVTTTTPGAGTATGNVLLAPGFSDAGTASTIVTVSDGQLRNDKSFTISIFNTNRSPSLAQPANMTVPPGATGDQGISATDPDADVITFTSSGPTFMTLTQNAQTGTTRTGNIHVAPGPSDPFGDNPATVSASDGTLADSRSFTITVGQCHSVPVLAQPANMSVAEGATADQILSATDACGNALTFSKVSGPAYMTVTTITPGTGTATGNIHLAPGFRDNGTYSATVGVSDGTSSSTRSFTITVNNVNGAPILNQPADMICVAEGTTADQAISASDPDGDPLTFSKVAGPVYMTVTTTSPTTGNIRLAPGFSDAGTAIGTVQVSDGALFDSKSFSIRVGCPNRPPVLNPAANMTVNEAATADQMLNATDADGDPLTFSKSAGPTFMTVTTTTPGAGTGTGNVHLAPGLLDAGTYMATVVAGDGITTDSKSFTITVNNVNQAPVLAQPANMTLGVGSTADQMLSATDPDGDPLTFSKVAGPTFMTVTSTVPGAGTATGNIHLAPGPADNASTFNATVSVSDGTLSNSKSFTIAVYTPNRPPTLAQPANMSVCSGTTRDQSISAFDPDGDALTFTKTSGPTFVTVTTTSPTSGNIHLAPSPGTSGTFSASVRVSDGSLSDEKPFGITVTSAPSAPTLSQPADMTVSEGATADQTLSGSEPSCGSPVTFSKVAGPLFMTVLTITLNPSTGNVHLAPNFFDAGTYVVTVRASTGVLNDDKSFRITVIDVDRPPVANPGGPYAGVSGIPVAFNGSASSDPDGNALTYAWDFGDGGTATGVTPSHIYTASGTFTVCLTATEVGGLALSNTSCTTVTISDVLAARVFRVKDKKVQLDSGQRQCFQIEPIGGNFALTDVDLATIVAKYGGAQVSPTTRKTIINADTDGNGIQEIDACFTAAALRTLFATAPNGVSTVTISLEGALRTGGSFRGDVTFQIQKGVEGAVAVAPNPLNPSAVLTFTTSRPGYAEVGLFDLQGRLVGTILGRSFMEAGVHEVRIEGRVGHGEKLASGIYFIRGIVAEGEFTRTIAILK